MVNESGKHNVSEAQEKTRLHEYLQPERVKLGLKAADKDDLFQKLVDLADQAGLLTRPRDFLQDLKRVEGEVGTGTGHGLAVPHAESDAVKEHFVFAVTLAEPISYNSHDGQPVDVVFFIGVRPRETGLHLKFLARLGRMAREAALLEKIRATKSPQEVCRVVAELETRLYS